MSEVASVLTFGLSDVIQGDKPFASFSEDKKEKKEAAAAADAQRQKEAEATVLAEQKAADEKKSKRASLMATSTSGFGANTNLARSFLTSL